MYQTRANSLLSWKFVLLNICFLSTLFYILNQSDNDIQYPSATTVSLSKISPQNPSIPKEPTTPPSKPSEPSTKEEEAPYIIFERKVDPFEKNMPVDRQGTSAYLEKGGVIETKDPRRMFLCHISLRQHCVSREIADVIDQVYAFCPIYSVDHNRHTMLYYRHTNFLGYLKVQGIKSVVLEAIYPGQKFKVTRAGNEPWEIQLEIHDFFYYRENLLNVAIRKTQHLDYEYILWIDAHEMFLNTYWWEEGIYQMAKYPSVSFFQTLAHVDDPRNKTIPWFDLAGVQYAYKTTVDLSKWIFASKGMWNGNAVGVRREIYDQIGYVVDECIAGCCDCAFNYATMMTYWDRMDIYGFYGKQLMPWVENARKYMGGENGVVRGRVYHFYHEYFFDWGKYLRSLTYTNVNLTKELYRDENFTLHISPNSQLSRIFERY